MTIVEDYQGLKTEWLLFLDKAYPQESEHWPTPPELRGVGRFLFWLRGQDYKIIAPPLPCGDSDQDPIHPIDPEDLDQDKLYATLATGDRAFFFTVTIFEYSKDKEKSFRFAIIPARSSEFGPTVPEAYEVAQRFLNRVYPNGGFEIMGLFKELEPTRAFHVPDSGRG